MNTIMEESKTTSDYVYEDEFSFVTKDNEVFLKGGPKTEERKICDLGGGEIQSEIEDLQNAFASLKQKVQEMAGRETITTEELHDLKEEVRTAKAIGDFDELHELIEQLEHRIGSSEAEATEETGGEAEEPVAADVAEQDEEDPEQAESGDEDDPISFYRRLAKQAEALSNQNDWSYVESELDNLSRQWSEGPEVEAEEEIKKLFQKFTRSANKFEERKKEHLEKVNERKKKNLARKRELLTQFKKIIENEEWTATGKVGKLKNQWSSVGPLPSGEGEDLDQKFDELVSVFNEHKVDRLVQKRQKEEDNLMLKLIVLDKMENIVSSIDASVKDWRKLEDDFDSLTRQWKKIGRVPGEKSNEVWGRYKNAQDEYYNRKYEFDAEHRKKVDQYRSKKEKICEEAEALLEAEDLATASRKMNKLHRRWKSIGNLPQRDENELWDRFKAATDSFNVRRSENIDKLHEQEEEHYRQKLQLIEQANAIKDTTDWDEGHRKMQSLMEKWKTIGPVPRKKSNKIWKQFKEAMDAFYDLRREHYKEIKEERKDNLREKQEILEQLRELSQHEDPIKAVDLAKPLQEKFKEAGYVPIKKKNKIWKQYRRVCDVIYDRFRAAKSGNKFDQELAKADLEHDQREKIQEMRKKFKKIQKEVSSLEGEVLQYKESMTYFKPSGKGNDLIDEIQQKIDRAENKLQEKQDQLDTLARKIEDIKAES